jgi:hypothetical protein
MILLILFLKLPKNQPLEDFPGSRIANRNSPSPSLCRKTPKPVNWLPGCGRYYSGRWSCRRAREPALAEASHCSHLLASGSPLPGVTARLGHGSIRTAQEIYSHMIHGQDDEAAKKWEEFQNRPASGEPQRKGQIQ